MLDYSKKNQVSAEVYLGWMMTYFYKLDVKLINMLFYRIMPDGKIVENDINL